jgi:hypothetical protein
MNRYEIMLGKQPELKKITLGELLDIKIFEPPDWVSRDDYGKRGEVIKEAFLPDQWPLYRNALGSFHSTARFDLTEADIPDTARKDLSL